MTLEVSDGSRVPLVDVRRAEINPHFFSRDKYYVQVQLRDGTIKDVIEQLSSEIAHEKKNEITRSIDEAWTELDSYDYGYSAGVAEGKSEGYSAGRADGESEGRRVGYAEGFEECRRWMLSYMFEAREAYTCELTYTGDLQRSSRRFLRNAVTVLTGLIERFLPPPTEHG